jgi:hypothetical protein
MWLASGGDPPRLARRNRTDFYALLARHHLQPAEFKAPD